MERRESEQSRQGQKGAGRRRRAVTSLRMRILICAAEDFGRKKSLINLVGTETVNG